MLLDSLFKDVDVLKFAIPFVGIKVEIGTVKY